MDYKEILKGIVNIINTVKNSDIGFVNICNYISENCPELKESEDERIRKVLLNDFKNHCSEFYCEGVNRDMIIDWLERQGEQKPAVDTIVFIPKFRVGDIVKSKSRPTLSPRKIISIDKQCYWCEDGLCLGFVWEDDYEIVEQKPVTWSEDDENMKLSIKGCVNAADMTSEGRKEIFAWLEKQGNTNVFDVPKTSIKDAVEITSRIQHIEDDMKPIAEFIINYANWNLHKDECNQPTLTVPLFRVLDALIQRGKPYGECVQNIEKMDE